MKKYFAITYFVLLTLFSVYSFTTVQDTFQARQEFIADTGKGLFRGRQAKFIDSLKVSSFNNYLLIGTNSSGKFIQKDSSRASRISDSSIVSKRTYLSDSSRVSHISDSSFKSAYSRQSDSSRASFVSDTSICSKHSIISDSSIVSHISDSSFKSAYSTQSDSSRASFKADTSIKSQHSIISDSSGLNREWYTSGTSIINKNSGNVGIGISPRVKLDVVGSYSGVSPLTADRIFALTNDATTGLNCVFPIISGSAGVSAFEFGDKEHQDQGGFYYNNADDHMDMRTNANQFAYINSSGYFTLGNSSGTERFYMPSGNIYLGSGGLIKWGGNNELCYANSSSHYFVVATNGHNSILVDVDGKTTIGNSFGSYKFNVEGDCNLSDGYKYKINGNDISASDVGALGLHDKADSASSARSLKFGSAPTIYSDSSAAYAGGVRPWETYITTGGNVRIMY